MLFSYVALLLLSTTSFVCALPLLDVKWSINVPDCLQPNHMDAGPWSTIQDMNLYLRDAAKTRVLYFWSGGIDSLGTKDVAERCMGNAGSNDLMLSMAMWNMKKFIMPTDNAYNKDPKAHELWEDASEVFAKYMVNTVYTLTGSSSVESVWLWVELPQLRENPNMKAII